MKFLIPFLMFVSVAQAQTSDLKVLNVIDGDSIIISAPFLPKELKQTLILRIEGVDTPEFGRKAKCRQEKEKSEQARNYVIKEIDKASEVRIILRKWDKYGGRVLGDLELDSNLLSRKLIDTGHAVEYKGGKKRSWCRKWIW